MSSSSMRNRQSRRFPRSLSRLRHSKTASRPFGGIPPSRCDRDSIQDSISNIGDYMKRAIISVLTWAGLAGMGAALAQSYPTRPVTMIVPYGAGGPLDTLTRIVSERMRVSLGQSIVIENVTGASGTVGVGRAVRAAPDGYT